MLNNARLKQSHGIVGVKCKSRAILCLRTTPFVKIPYALVLKQWDFISPSTAERMKPRLSNFGIG